MNTRRFNKQQSPSYIEHVVEVRSQRVMVDYINVGMQCGRTRSFANISTQMSANICTCQAIHTHTVL